LTDLITISSDSLDSTAACEFDDSSMVVVWALISLALDVIFNSQDKLISASLVVSSISWSRKRLLAFKIRSTKSDELSDFEVLESVWDERGDNELFSFCLTNAFLVILLGLYRFLLWPIGICIEAWGNSTSLSVTAKIIIWTLI